MSSHQKTVSHKDSGKTGDPEPLSSPSPLRGHAEIEAWCVRFPISKENLEGRRVFNLPIVHVDSIYFKNSCDNQITSVGQMVEQMTSPGLVIWAAGEVGCLSSVLT